MPEQHVFVAFAREHPKFIYFLLATAAAATGYALGDISEDETLRWAHFLLGAAVAAWMLSFGIGCMRLISMLSGLYEVSTDLDPPEPYYTYIKEGDRAQLAAATDAASSSAKWQMWCFFGGVAFYVIWILENLLS